MSDSAIFLIFTVIWLGPTVVLAIRMTAAQRKFLRAYRLAHSGVELLDDGSDPTQILSQLKRAGNAISAYQEEQDDPELEELRQVVAQRIKDAGIWGFGCPIASFIIVTLFQL